MSRNETRYLSQLLKLLDDEAEVPRAMAQAKINWIIWSIITLTITYVFYHNDRLNIVVGVLLVFISGLFVGCAIFQGVANKQWRLLKPHLKKDSLERRINEIKT